MTEKEFYKLCNGTPVGTTLSFNTGNDQLRGNFVGCSADGVVIETNGQSFIWPRELIDYRKTDPQIPTYS
jgi:hypothetical protein